MASKERELLKRVVKVFDSVYSADLIDEIEELLAQPEQKPARKVVIGDSFMIDGTKYIKAREPLSETDVEDRYNNCEYVIFHRDYRAGYAKAELDLKREPLSDEEIHNVFMRSSVGYDKKCFIKGIKAAEKMHGIRSFEDE